MSSTVSVEWTPERWLAQRTFPALPGAARRLSRNGTRRERSLAVVLVARDDASTLGKHLLALRPGWHGGIPPWTVVAVADMGSIDETVGIARDHGAMVLEDPSPRLAASRPAALGAAVVRAVRLVPADLLLVVPARLARVDWDACARLLEILLDNPSLALVQGFEPPPGGLLSWTLGRPLLASFLPVVAGLADPACPILAVDRQTIADIPVAQSVAYEPALIAELVMRGGAGLVGQVAVPPLVWPQDHPPHDAGDAFRCALALHETLARHGRGVAPREEPLIHVRSHLRLRPDGTLSPLARLETFRWIRPADDRPA